EDSGARVTLPTGTSMLIRWGERVEAKGRHGPLQRQTVAKREVGSVDDGLLERLREWRLRRAGTDGVPAYVVAHDSHLESIAAAQPTSLDELADCDGIGPSRLERYGEEILEVVET
ncbi:MAG: HrdC, partial [Acidimicrobiia bacterium]|nr:HrdC [Acidimicrobiia bacterium]